MLGCAAVAHAPALGRIRNDHKASAQVKGYHFDSGPSFFAGLSGNKHYLLACSYTAPAWEMPELSQ